MIRYSSSRRRTATTQRAPIAAPTAIPPTASTKKVPRASIVLNVPVAAAAIAKRNSTGPVASLSRLSPSSRVAEPLGQAHALKHRLGRDGIGGRHDGAERRARRPGERGHDQVGNDRDDDRGEYHRPEGEREDARQMPPEVLEWREIGAIHQQGRREDDEDQLRVQRNGRRTRQEHQDASPGEQRHAGGSRSFRAPY